MGETILSQKQPRKKKKNHHFFSAGGGGEDKNKKQTWLHLFFSPRFQPEEVFVFLGCFFPKSYFKNWIQPRRMMKQTFFQCNFAPEFSVAHLLLTQVLKRTVTDTSGLLDPSRFSYGFLCRGFMAGQPTPDPNKADNDQG